MSDIDQTTQQLDRYDQTVELDATVREESPSHLAGVQSRSSSQLVMSMRSVLSHLMEVPLQAFLYDENFPKFLTAWQFVVEEILNGDEPQVESLHVWSVNDLGDKEADRIRVRGYKLAAYDIIRTTAGIVGHPIKYSAGNFWLYNGKSWEEVQPSHFSLFLRSACLRIGVPRIHSEDSSFLDDLERQMKKQMTVEFGTLGRNMLNFQNGTLKVLPDGELEFCHHDPLDQLHYTLSFDYDPRAGCEQWLSFLDQVIPEPEKQANLAEFLGSCFHEVKHEKVLFLYGSGANGKSVVLEVVKRLLGEDNLSHTSLDQLCNRNSYFLKDLMVSLLNYSGEISYSVNADMLKRLASREPQTGRFPGGRPFKVKDYARLAFNANVLPESDDVSDGYFRRMLIIPFEITVPTEQRNPHLPDEIAETDLPGIINWVITGLQRLLRQEGQFTESPSSERILMEYRHQSNPVEHFVEVFSGQLAEGVGGADLFSFYQDFCLNYGHRASSQKEFTARITRLGRVTKSRTSAGVRYTLNS